MAQTPKTPKPDIDDIEDGEQPQRSTRKLDLEGVKEALPRVITGIIEGCSFDMDDGAIFGRAMTRVRAWLKEHDAPKDMLADSMDAIQNEVRKHIANRDKEAVVRAQGVQARQNAAIQKAIA